MKFICSVLHLIFIEFCRKTCCADVKTVSEVTFYNSRKFINYIGASSISSKNIDRSLSYFAIADFFCHNLDGRKQ